MQKVFISYSHQDDKAFGPRGQQWVKTFAQALDETLTQRVGNGRVTLWRDKREMDEATCFDDVIRDELDAADLLLTVLSSNYLVSAYCRQELHRFGERRTPLPGLRVGTHSRIFKVFRAPNVSRNDLKQFAELPPLVSEIDASEGFKVYCGDDKTYRDALLEPEGLMLVWQKADDIARAIEDILQQTQTLPPPVAQPPKSGMTIYLARPASDMVKDHDELRRALEYHCTVLPSGAAPEDAAAYADSVRADLARSQLSLHLLGQRSGLTPDGGDEPVAALQARLALEAQHGGFASLFWSPASRLQGSDGIAAATTSAAASASPPPGTAVVAPPPDAAMSALRERLHRLSLPASRAEYLVDAHCRLKELVMDRLKAAAAPPQVPASMAAPGGCNLYLVCDRADREDTKALRASLTESGFSVTRPPSEGTPKELDDDHKRCLVSCDIVVVVWGKVREPWIRKKLADIQQAPGWGRQLPLRAAVLLLGPPPSAAKSDFDPPPGVRVLQAGDLSAALGPLLG